MQFNYKDGQLKSKYERKIKEINALEVKDKALIEELNKEALQEVKEIKEYKNTTLDVFKKRTILLAVFADILLLAGVILLIVGFVNAAKDNTGTVYIIIGGAILLGAAILFGLAEYNRERKRKFLSEIISDSELIATKELVKDFYENK